MPKISIIIPTYNRAVLLPRAIQSVINQTFKDWELIIVDDGSTDTTKEVIEEFIKKDQRIKYLWEPNSGWASKPRNLGIQNAQGEYITFLDSDDEYLPNNLIRHLEIHTKYQDIDLSGSDMYMLGDKDNNKKFYSYSSAFGRLTIEQVLKITFSPNTMFFKTEFLKKIGEFDENLRYSEDLDVTIRSATVGTVFLIKECLVKVYPSAVSLTRTPDSYKISDGLSPFFTKHFETYKRYNELAYYYFIWGYMNCSVMNNFSLGRNHLKQSLKYSNKKRRIYFIYYVTSLFGRRFWDFAINIHGVYRRYIEKKRIIFSRNFESE